MVFPFLTNEALKRFVEGLKITQEQKDLIISKIPHLDKEERTRLFNLLQEIYLLDLEEEEIVKKIRQMTLK